ncbi:MAG: Hsp20/alpha crystallin family protein [Acidithiobacillus sp.]|nr:Hsp20/alpha crystallin family protein [Acidithiobacillus sp.]
MDFDLKKWAPWNWFKKEQEEQTATSLPVQRSSTLPIDQGQFSGVLQLQRQIDRLFDDALRNFGFPTLAWPRLSADWPGLLRPALDIQETDKQYKISLEIPGVEEKDIELFLDDNVLTIRGEKRQEVDRTEGGFHRIERSYGSFQRVLNLPENANQDAIRATFKNGVLTITIDKREPSTARLGRSIPIEH